MKLKIEIELGNDAMQTGDDVVSLLAKNLPVISESVSIAQTSDEKWDNGRLLDVNGNEVGYWTCE